MNLKGCVFTKDINKAMLISDAMETGTIHINSASARFLSRLGCDILLTS